MMRLVQGDVIPESMFRRPPVKPTWEDFQDPEKRKLIIAESIRQSALNAMPQVDALLAAGWKFEIPSISGTEPWQWAWRRPPRKKNSQGRRFASTNQAYSAMKREQGIVGATE